MFDIYGTLFISASGDIGISRGSDQPLQQLAELLTRHHLNLQPRDLLERYYRTIEADHRRSSARGIEYPEVDIIGIWKEVLKITSSERVQDFAIEFEMLSNPTYPMPNLVEILAHCRKKGIKMGLISNAQFYTPFLFKLFLGVDTEKLGFDSRLLFFSYRHGRAKPDSYLYRLASEQLQQLDISASEVLYVGNDMLNDIYPAKQEGFLTALFAGDARSLRLRKEDPRCSKLTPELVITDLIQLTPYLTTESN